MRDFGLKVSSRFQHGPLWKLSPRALRLWMYLAMKAQHAPTIHRLDDGRRLTIASGQWFTSTRTLRKDLGGTGSHETFTALLAELQDHGTVRVEPVRRYGNRNGDVTEAVTGGVTESVTGKAVLGSLVTVMGQSLTRTPVTETVTKDKYRENGLPPVSQKEHEEWAQGDAVLIAEGR